jgi:hypothetical protein
MESATASWLLFFEVHYLYGDYFDVFKCNILTFIDALSMVSFSLDLHVFFQYL